ncbi:cytochrome P450, partial [Scleroderma yunnanense]
VFSLTYNKLLKLIFSVDVIDIAAGLAAIIALRLARLATRKRSKTTRLRGPPSPSLFYGVGKVILGSSDPGAVYEAWAKEYGVVYEIPMTLGQRKIVLCDPCALSHLLVRDTWTYVGAPETKAMLEKSVGKGVMWAEGDDHRRQRRSVAFAFNSTAVRKLAPIFFNIVHKMKIVWEDIIDTDGDSKSAIIDVQDRFQRMNRISLDAIGLAGFGHDFSTLDGKKGSMALALDAFGAPSGKRKAINSGFYLLMQMFPVLFRIPTPRNRMFDELHKSTASVSIALHEKSEKGKEENSIIGFLSKIQNTGTNFHITQYELQSLMKILLVAGYETTSITITWALIELSNNPDIQMKLRKEFLAFDGEPTYDQLQKKFPYLDAVVHEALRVHPAASEMIRQAKEDDIIPLSEGVRTKSDQVVHSLCISHGTSVCVPIACVNRSNAIWGPDAKVFRPERWLETGGVTEKLPGYRHLMTFFDGPKTCLGKLFAVAEITIVLSVFVKNFVFEMRDGPNTRVEIGGIGILPRPKVTGEDGTKLPLRVRRYDG